MSIGVPYYIPPDREHQLLDSGVAHVKTDGTGTHVDIVTALNDSTIKTVLCYPGTHTYDNSGGRRNINGKSIWGFGRDKTTIARTDPSNEVFQLGASDFRDITMSGGTSADIEFLRMNRNTAGSFGVENVTVACGNGIFVRRSVGLYIKNLAGISQGTFVRCGESASANAPIALAISELVASTCTEPIIKVNYGNSGIRTAINITNCLFTVPGANNIYAIEIAGTFVGDVTTNGCTFTSSYEYGVMIDGAAGAPDLDAFIPTGAYYTSITDTNSAFVEAVTGANSGYVRLGGTFLDGALIGGSIETSGYYYDTRLNKFIDLSATDTLTQTVFRNNGGDFDTIDEALDYFDTQTLTSDNRGTLIVGSGTFVVDNSAGARTLPNFLDVFGQFDEQATFITGNTPANDMWTINQNVLANINFDQCDTAITKGGTGIQAGYLRSCQLGSNNANLLVLQTGGIMNVQGCSTAFAAGLVESTGGTSCAVVGCVSVFTTGFAVTINGTDAAQVSGCTFQLCAGGVECNGGTGTSTIVQGNTFTDCTTGIELDGLLGEFTSVANTNVTTGAKVAVRIVSGTTINYTFASDLMPSTKFDIQGGLQDPQNYTDTATGDDITAGDHRVLLTGRAVHRRARRGD